MVNIFVKYYNLFYFILFFKLILKIFLGKSQKNKGKVSKNKKYTKDQIGLPENFRHLQHIGWDPNRGFDLGQIKDPQLNKFFAKVWYL